MHTNVILHKLISQMLI